MIPGSSLRALVSSGLVPKTTSRTAGRQVCVESTHSRRRQPDGGFGGAWEQLRTLVSRFGSRSYDTEESSKCHREESRHCTLPSPILPAWEDRVDIRCRKWMNK